MVTVTLRPLYIREVNPVRIEVAAYQNPRAGLDMFQI
jgi:hypothetical protein